MDVNELHRIDEETAEAHLADACPLCGGRLHLRLIGLRGTTYCPTCKVLGEVVLEGDPARGFTLEARTKASA